MSIHFTGTDAVSVAPAASINNLHTETLLFWINLDSIVAGAIFTAKQANSGGSNLFRLSGASGNIEFRRVRNGGPLSYITNNTPVSAGSWFCVASTYDDSLSSNAAHIYVGSRSAAMVEATYGTQTEGTGQADSPNDTKELCWGNIDSLGSSSCIPGSMAVAMFWNRVLSLGELKAQQYRPRFTSGLVNYIWFGFNGLSTQPDWSGNANVGTVVGSNTLTPNAPLGPAFGIGAPTGFRTAGPPPNNPPSGRIVIIAG